MSSGIKLDTDQYDNSSEPAFATMMDQDDDSSWMCQTLTSSSTPRWGDTT